MGLILFKSIKFNIHKSRSLKTFKFGTIGLRI